MRTLLQLAQEFCRRQGVPVPQTVINSQDDQTQQIWGLLNEGQSDLIDRGDWQQMWAVSSIFQSNGYSYPAGGGQYIAAYFSETGTSSNAVVQGGIGGLLPYGSGYLIAPGLKKILPNTFFCNSTRLPVYGPMTATEWATVRALIATPAQFSWRMEGDALIIYPYSAAATFSFQYVNRFPCFDTASTGGNPARVYDLFVSDTAASVLPDKIVLQDLKWRWKYVKELPYAEDQRILEQMVADALGSNVTGPDVQMDNTPDDRVAGPGLLVAAGSWLQ